MKVQKKIKYTILSFFFSIFTAFTGFETNNKYKVKNSLGQTVYFAAEGTVIPSNPIS